MPRQPRYALVGIPQYVIQRGNNRQATFFTGGFQASCHCFFHAA